MAFFLHKDESLALVLVEEEDRQKSNLCVFAFFLYRCHRRCCGWFHRIKLPVVKQRGRKETIIIRGACQRSTTRLFFFFTSVQPARACQKPHLFFISPSQSSSPRFLLLLLPIRTFIVFFSFSLYRISLNCPEHLHAGHVCLLLHPSRRVRRLASCSAPHDTHTRPSLCRPTP